MAHQAIGKLLASAQPVDSNRRMESAGDVEMRTGAIEGAGCPGAMITRTCTAIGRTS